MAARALRAKLNEMWRSAQGVTVLVASVVFVLPAYAQQKTLAGRWSATAMRSDWNIGDWSKACGPTPNGGGEPGGSVVIAQIGSELSISGAGRTYSTTECWEQFPGLARVSHAASSRSFRNVCKTGPKDSRQATVITTISATDAQISFDETGQYQFVLAGQNCTASTRRTRVFTLLAREGETPIAAASTPASATATAIGTRAAANPAAAPKPLSAPQRPCEVPGPPDRLEVRPSRKLIRQGESFTFRTSVLDRDGCGLGLMPAWRVVTPGSTLRFSAPGRVEVPEDAAQGTVELQASMGGRAVKVFLEVASRERYDALLQQEGFNADGESAEAAATRVVTSTIGGRAAVVRDEAEHRRVLFAGVVGALALVLGVVGFLILQKSRRAAPPPSSPPIRVRRVSSTPVPAAAPPPAKLCPTCREEFPPESVFCSNDGNRLIPASGPVEPTAPIGSVCPICGQGYDPGVTACPRHQEELVPVAVYARMRAPELPIVSKICPVCGTQFLGHTQFCGRCGASLVPVN